MILHPGINIAVGHFSTVLLTHFSRDCFGKFRTIQVVIVDSHYPIFIRRFLPIARNKDQGKNQNRDSLNRGDRKLNMWLQFLFHTVYWILYKTSSFTV